LNKYFGLAVVVLFGLAAAAQAAPVHCPEQLSVDQHAVHLPSGLQAFDIASQHHWVNVQFSGRSPVEQVWLAPENTRRDWKLFVNV
jgi:hypothetical protein